MAAQIALAVAGQVAADDALTVVRRLQEFQTRIFANYWDLDTLSREAVETEPFLARANWREIADLSPGRQRAAVESLCGFRTPAMFHQLCARSLELGIEDPIRGVRIASLAVKSLEHLAFQLDESLYCSLLARAYGISAEALRRVGRLDRAAAVLATAEELLERAGDGVLSVVVSEVSIYRGMLLLSQGEVEEVREMMERSLGITGAIVDRLKRDRAMDVSDACSTEELAELEAEARLSAEALAEQARQARLRAEAELERLRSRKR